MKKNILKKTLQFYTAGDGCKIAYRIDGTDNKPVLLLSNSIATDMYMWDEQIPAFTEHFTLLRFDTRGNGNSDSPLGDYSIDRMGNDVLELLHHLEIDNISFCGLSLGGLIAQWVAIHQPEKIKKLILANTSPYLGPNDGWDQNIKTLRHNSDMQPFADMFINNWFPGKMITENPDIIAPFTTMVLKTTAVGLAGCFAAVRDADMRRTVALINAPTLVVAGEYDTVTIPQHSELLAATIPGAKLIKLPATHLSNIEFPADFENLVLNFLLQ